MKSILRNSTRLLACLAATVVAYAAVTTNSDGSIFVGKGDVQTIFGWNNQTLQKNAKDVEFQVHSTVVTEHSWVCVNNNNGQSTAEKSVTETITTEGMLSSETRDNRNQITGFILTGFDGTVKTTTYDKELEPYSCGNGQTAVSLTDLQSVTEPVLSLQVGFNGTWVDLE
jgi:hypothetical protein